MADNRRVKYTKLLLRESLIKFLLEKPISRITVKELCANADVNRATYYAHYADPYDQITQIKDEFITGINRYVDEYMASPGHDGARNVLTSIFEYLVKDADLCIIFLSDRGGLSFQEDFLHLIRSRVLQDWRRTPEQLPEDSEYALTFVTSGIMGLARRWLEEGEGRMPPERMAALMTELVQHNLRGAGEPNGRTGRIWTS